MQFRPCIDVHNGKVKQIVGESLRDQKNEALENFVSEDPAARYAELFARKGLQGGHVILLNPRGSDFYEATKAQAISALKAWPGGLQAGGGIGPDNAEEFLRAGASHVIVTSFLFEAGRFRPDRLEEMKKAVGKERLVLDLSCKKREGGYRVVCDRWQRETDLWLDGDTLDMLSESCDGFLIHAADAEGKQEGVERPLVRLLGGWGKRPVTYAGGVRDLADLLLIKKEGRDRVDVTVGSALDIYGGRLGLEDVMKVV